MTTPKHPATVTLSREDAEEMAILVASIKSFGVNPEKLVVESMPFGGLIDSETRKRFTCEKAFHSWLAYDICELIKLAAKLTADGDTNE